MAVNIRNMTALVTGGAKRVGRATALAFANKGVNVIVHYRSSSAEADELIEEIRALGVRGWAIQADLADQQQLGSLMARAIAEAGTVHILVNNASAFPESEFDSITLDDVIGSVTTEAWAPFALARDFAKQAEARQIVNMLDTRAFSEYDWQHLAYNAAKHMLVLFTKMMAVKLAPRIAVNAVAPGLILPPEGMPMSYIEGLKDSLPMKRIGSPEFVAEAIIFLIGTEFTTGQVIFVDGGRHLREVGVG